MEASAGLGTVVYDHDPPLAAGSGVMVPPVSLMVVNQ
jgi:hypothetical protein